jgi:hypothetical protein
MVPDVAALLLIGRNPRSVISSEIIGQHCSRGRRMVNLKMFLGTVILFAASQWAFADSNGSFTKTLTVSGAQEVEISTVGGRQLGAGAITVRSTDENKIVITGKINAGDTWFRGGLTSEEKVRRIQATPPVQQMHSLILIGRIADENLSYNVSISYDIEVPAATRLRIDSGSGEVFVEGVTGSVRLNCGSGNVTAKRLGEEVRISTGSGNIRLDGARGAVRLDAGRGNIEASGVVGAFYGETGSGDITLRQESSSTVSARTGSGRIRLHNVSGGLDAQSGKGDIEIDGDAKSDWTLQSQFGSLKLTLPAKAAFSLNARSSSGIVTVSRPITVQGEVKSNRVQGQVGAGGPLLSLETSSGEIRVQ